MSDETRQGAQTDDDGNNGNGGSRQWQPGTLPTIELEQLLQDVLADLWTDTYRRDQLPGARVRMFRRTVETALYCATGQELWITTRQSERG